jgi:predicted transcriptional regulator
MCHILEEKGLLRSHAEGTRRIYFPTVNLRTARRSAEDNIVETFFGGSPYMLVAALLDARRDELSDADVTRLTEMIDSAEKARKGRKARG